MQPYNKEVTKRMRPEFRRLCKEYKTPQALADFLGTSKGNVLMMRSRGYMSEGMATMADWYSSHKYKAHLLIKEGEG